MLPDSDTWENALKNFLCHVHVSMNASMHIGAKKVPLKDRPHPLTLPPSSLFQVFVALLLFLLSPLSPLCPLFSLFSPAMMQRQYHTVQITDFLCDFYLYVAFLLLYSSLFLFEIGFLFVNFICHGINSVYNIYFKITEICLLLSPEC